MTRASVLCFALLTLAVGTQVHAAEPAAAHAAPPPAAAGPPLAARLAGNTLNVVAFIPRQPGAPGGGELTRLIVQAYLRPDGRALMRVWDPWHNRYTAPAERPWSLTGSTLCLDVPAPGNGPMCADVHMWGPRIAGVGAKPYAMLDGDIKPGNVIGGLR